MDCLNRKYYFFIINSHQKIIGYVDNIKEANEICRVFPELSWDANNNTPTKQIPYFSGSSYNAELWGMAKKTNTKKQFHIVINN
jgi:hypothetical protein